MINAMIISVGGTTAPIIKSITEYRPEFVSFFASQDTADYVLEIKKGVHGTRHSIKNEITLADDVNVKRSPHSLIHTSLRRRKRWPMKSR